MYLSNIELRKLLPQMNIVVTNEDHPFDPENQIQLCSIDLRISNVFWRQKRFYRAVDLGERKEFELAPRREWKRIEIKFNESIILKPGELLIGRTYESFKIPKEYAGKIVAKSSIARLGVSIFCSTDFINPGWFGHCPLVIKNHGIHTFKMYPLLHVCQIMVIGLSSVPEGEFGIGQFVSSYQNDDGGPSFWWRDQVFRSIKVDHHALSRSTIDELIAIVQNLDDEGLSRFKLFLSRDKVRRLGNSKDILNKFAKIEKRKMKFQRVAKGILGVIQGVLVSTSVGLFFYTNHDFYHYLFWMITLILFPYTIWFLFLRDERQYHFTIKIPS